MVEDMEGILRVGSPEPHILLAPLLILHVFCTFEIILKKVKDLHTARKSQLSRTLLDPRRPSKIHAMLITDKWHIYLPIWSILTFPESSLNNLSIK